MNKVAIKRVRREKGQGLVEFAMILVILLFLVVGAIGAISLVGESSALNQVGRDGARWAAKYGGDTAEVRDLIDRQLQNVNIEPSEVTIIIRIYDASDLSTPVKDSSVGDTATCDNYGQPVEVELRKPWRLHPVLAEMAGGFDVSSVHEVRHIDGCWRTGDVS